MSMAPLVSSRSALLLAVVLLAAKAGAQINETEPGDDATGGEEGVCLHSMFIFTAVPVNRDDNNAAFLQASEELNDKMMEFCDTFKDGGDFFGLGRKCHTKLSSNTSVPSVSVEVEGCCEGSAASALWEKFGKNLRRCKTVGAGRDPLRLAVTIVEGQEEEEEEEEEEESSSPPPDSAPRTVETRSVTENVVDADDEQAIRGFEATVMDAMKDWRFWVILALSLLIMLLLLLLCICCLCSRHKKRKQEEEDEGEKRSLRIRVDHSPQPTSPLLYTKGRNRSIVVAEDVDGRGPAAIDNGSREIVAAVDDDDDNRSLVPIDEPSSSPMVQRPRSTKEMVEIGVDDGLDERRIVATTDSEDDDEDLQQLSRQKSPSEEVVRNDLVPVDVAEPDSSMQQAPPAPTPWRMSRIGRMSASDEERIVSQYRQQHQAAGGGSKDLVAMPSDGSLRDR